MARFALNPENIPIANLTTGRATPEFNRWLVKVQGVLGEDVVALIQAAPLLTYSPSATLTADKVLTQGAGLSFTSGASTFTLALSTTGVTAAAYGSASQVPSFTVDAYGRLTLAANVTITPAAIGAASSATTVTAGAGLTGGGDLSANRTFDVGAGTGITVNANDVALDTTHVRNVDHSAVSITSGAGLTGGGDISATRTLAVGAGTGITVNADDVALDTSSTRNTDHAGVTLTAGAGLTGGGDISANRTFTVGAGTGITVNADDVALTVPTASGTYTPTLTNVANLDASTAYACQYLRVGNSVTVSGRVEMDATAGATQTDLGMTLPIASNFANAQECGGTAFCASVAGLGSAIFADTANDRANFRYISSDTANRGFWFNFTYQII